MVATRVLNTASNGIAENAPYLYLLRALRCTTAKRAFFVNVLWVPRNTAFLREAEQIGGDMLHRIVVVVLCILLASMNADARMPVQHCTC